MARNDKDPLVYFPSRIRKSQKDRLEEQRDARGYEDTAPVTRLAIERGLSVLEAESEALKTLDNNG